MTHIVTKATHIQFINSKKCHIKKRKSRKTALSGYYTCVSRCLLLMPSGVDTYINIRGQNDLRNQVCVRLV